MMTTQNKSVRYPCKKKYKRNIYQARQVFRKIKVHEDAPCMMIDKQEDWDKMKIKDELILSLADFVPTPKPGSILTFREFERDRETRQISQLIFTSSWS